MITRKNTLIITFFIFLFLFSYRPVLADAMIDPEEARVYLITDLVYFAVMFFVTIIIECLVLFILGLRRRRYLWSIFFANLISWPIFVFLSLGLFRVYIDVFLMEFFVVLFEAFFIYFLNKELKLWKLLVMVFLANFISMLISMLEIFHVSLHNHILKVGLSSLWGTSAL